MACTYLRASTATTPGREAWCGLGAGIRHQAEGLAVLVSLASNGAEANRSCGGLAGLFLIEDDESQSLRLPSEYGVDDIPLVIQDRRFNRDGSFDYLSAMSDVMMGYKGNVILVNGTVDPHLVLRRQRTRLRLLNASNSRIYTLGRDDGADLLIIGSDGSLLERPARQRRVRVGPGERIELLVDAQAERDIRLMSYPDPVAASGMGGAGDDDGRHGWQH
jgi:blue copper oxidase